ncbi:MAG: hypothetical protein IJ003_04150 [Candidatus Gastranaerophilales bacterium]|nr:hypothetical protein [Candidatus Gastranaerophilales bacterium]
MKISNINLINTQKKNIQNTNKKLNNTYFQQNTNSFLPTTSQFLAFLGYPTSLSQTYEHLKSEEYPPEIKSMVEKTLKQNPQGKTLYDVHFSKYKGVLDCYSLDDLKEKYPEFEEVQSAYDVNARPDSFLGKVLSGESDIFPNNEDLTLQLIKLYWGQGFSLNDLADYVEKNSSTQEKTKLYYTMHNKLNIPLMTRQYAKVLKLSNKNYYEKYSQELSIKLKEAAEAKKQSQDGEPVIIPRGPLSAAHRLHISQGLKRYYQENPDAIYRQTNRQKEFYHRSLEEREEMSVAMDYAWNSTQEGRTVKKYLTKFMKKNEPTQKQLILEEEMTQEQRNLLKEFWDKNPWAKDKFSIASKKGWEFVKDETNVKFNGKSVSGLKIAFSISSTKLVKNILKWAKSMGITVSPERIGKGVISKEGDYLESEVLINEAKRTNAIYQSYIDKHPQEADKEATALQLAMISLKRDLEFRQQNLPKSLKNSKENIETLNNYLEELFKTNPLYETIMGCARLPINGIKYLDLVDTYSKIMQMALFMDCLDIADYTSAKIDEIRGYLDDNNQREINRILI